MCWLFIFKDTEPSPLQDSSSVRQQGGLPGPPPRSPRPRRSRFAGTLSTEAPVRPGFDSTTNPVFLFSFPGLLVGDFSNLNLGVHVDERLSRNILVIHLLVMGSL